MTLTSQPLGCVTVMLRPATTRDPVRSGPVFADTLNSTRPAPVPVEPLLIAIQLVALAAVHGHPLAVLTVIALVLPVMGAL